MASLMATKKAMWSSDLWQQALETVAAMKGYPVARSGEAAAQQLTDKARRALAAADAFNEALALRNSLPKRLRGAMPAIDREFADNPQGWCGKSESS